jgi:mRNA interferase RelE/StbE
VKNYHFEFSPKADKQFSKLNRTTQMQILDWIEANLEGTTAPRSHGKSLQGKFTGLWRYRVGKYRLITKIEDSTLLILALSIAKREDIYRKGSELA